MCLPAAPSRGGWLGAGARMLDRYNMQSARVLSQQQSPGLQAVKQQEDLNPAYWYIHGRPYDLTKWRDEHPGGAVIIDACRGTDCTTLFETYHAASLRVEWISTLLERYSVEAPCIAVDKGWISTPVYDELRQAVQAYHMKHGVKATRSAVAGYVFWGILHYSFLYMWGTGAGDWRVPMLLGLTLWFYCGDMMHSGTHYALCKSANLSRAAAIVGGWMFCLPHTWTRQHVTGHHVHTNEQEMDPDLYHWKKIFHASPWDSLETATQYKSLWYLAPVFTQIVVPIIATVEIVTTGHWVGVREMIPFYKFEVATMSVWWCLYAALLATIAFFHGIAWALAPSVVCGILFYAFSQVSHLNAASFQPAKSNEWAVREITTTQGDYEYDSIMWNKLSLGLNNQTMHHLFPSVHPCHFPALSKSFHRIFKKHGLPLQCWNKTYMDSLVEHCMWLRYINSS